MHDMATRPAAESAAESAAELPPSNYYALEGD